MNNGPEDWIEELKRKEQDRREIQDNQARKQNLIGENLAGLWRVFRGYLQSESERYSREIGTVKIQFSSVPFAEFSVNTIGVYPSVHLRVECCGKDGRQFIYTYTVRKNYDVENEESNGRFIVDANGEDVFLRTPDGITFHDPKEAAKLLLRRVVESNT